MKKQTGYLDQPLDPRDVYIDEIVGGANHKEIPEQFRIDGLRFEPQGAHPYCAAMSTTKMLEYAYKQEGGHFEFSQPHLYYNSGGSYVGSYFRANLNTAKNKGCILEEKMMIPLNKWDFDKPIYTKLRKRALETPFEDVKKAGGYARVATVPWELKRAIMNYGPLMVGVYAGGGYWNPETERKSHKDNHACLLVGWDKEHWWLFDSLQPKKDFDGYHTVSRKYTFNSAYAIVDLPENWKDIRDKGRREPFAHCLNHYGEQRDLAKETEAAAKLLKEFKKFKNQSVMEAAGRFWTVLINAAAYGGYSISYRKWGRWMPGDLINFVYHWRRGGQYLFDLNKLRSDYK